MGSKEKYFSINSGGHGWDDLGFAQPTAPISSVARYGAQGKYLECALVTEGAAHGLVDGQAINIVGTTFYDGPTRVVHVINTTQYVIERAFVTTATGERNSKGADGNYEAIMPLGADMAAADITITFWDPKQAAGLDSPIALTKDKVYPVPAGIKTIAMVTAGNIRAFRGATRRPMGLRNPTAPTLVGLRPNTGSVGSSVIVAGNNLEPNSTSVWFNGTLAEPTRITETWIEVAVPAGATTGLVTAKVNGVHATGPTFSVS